jgi:hypothetical protein
MVNIEKLIPVQIKKVKDPEGKETLKATVPMNLIFEKDFDAKWLEEELAKFELNYFNLVKDLRSILNSLRLMKEKDGRVILYWKFGDKIVEFLEQNKKSPLFLTNLTKSLRRDVGISDKMILRCKRFRLLYPDIKMVDPKKSFVSYIASFEKGYISKNRQKKGRMSNNEKNRS